jgi:hypothetical protein
MITTHPQPIIDPHSARSMRKTILIANGCFLALVGGTQLIFELVSDISGISLFERPFASSQPTIGFLEAHGLALLIGLLLIFAASIEPKRFWQGFAACVQLLLGGANLLIWSSFVGWGYTPAGAIVTIAHVLLILTNLACLILVRNASIEL